MAPLRFVSLFALAGVVACTGTESASPPKNAGGTLVISTPGDPDVLIPALVSSIQASQITDLVYDHLADIGDSLTIVGDSGFRPALADRWSWGADSLSIAFHIHPNARWHDGKPVRATDVKFTHAAYTDSALGSPARALLANIDSVTVRDSSTAVFWYAKRSAQQFYDAAYTLLIMPEHVWKDTPMPAWRPSDIGKRPVGSGRFRFQRWTPKTAVEIVADTGNYRGAPKLSRVIWSISPDFNTAVTRFLSGEADIFEALRPEHMAEVAKNPALRVATFTSVDYLFAAFNLRDQTNKARPHPIFGSRDLRRALTMAVDRAAIVKSVYDTLAEPALGPMVRAFATTDRAQAQIPFDLARAQAKLDSLGWRDGNGDGIRERNGRPLRISLLVPGSSKARVQMAVLIQEQLRQAGARVEVEQVEFPTYAERMRKRTFDMVMGGWHTQASPGGARQSWGTAGVRAASGSNYPSYESAAFDASMDSALMELDFAKKKALFARAYDTIIQDAPAIWLAEPKAAIGYHKRLRTAPMRADAWWSHLAEWWIPENERIPRDNARPAAAVPAARPDSQKTP